MLGNSLVYAGATRPKAGYDICPTCKGLKTPHRKQCQKCQRREAAAEIERQEDAKRKAEMDERRPRYDAAYDAGWPFDDLRKRAAAGNLPTWEEIRAFQVGRLVKGFCRGMQEVG